jgi:hypothetical protein
MPLNFDVCIVVVLIAGCLVILRTAEQRDPDVRVKCEFRHWRLCLLQLPRRSIPGNCLEKHVEIQRASCRSRPKREVGDEVSAAVKDGCLQLYERCMRIQHLTFTYVCHGHPRRAAQPETLQKT